MAHGWTQLLSNRTGLRHVGRSLLETVSAALQQRQAAELEDLAKSDFVAERLERLTEQKFR